MKALADRAVTGTVHWASGILLVMGGLGLLRGQFAHFADHAGVSIFGFTGSPLTNLIHFALGVAGLAVAHAAAGLRRYALWSGSGLIVFAALELPLRDATADIFGRNGRMALADVVIGLALAVTWAWSRRAAGRPAVSPGR